MNVVFDMLHGEAVIGEQRIAAIDAGPNGALRVGSAGLALRPVSFGERTRIVTRAALTALPVDSLVAGLTAATLPAATPPIEERETIEVLALVLAGAEESGPPFSTAMVDLRRAAGWSITDILEAPAAEVDRLVATLVREPDDGWTRVEFGADPAAAEAAVDIAAIRSQLAENLLRRLDMPEQVLTNARFEDPPTSDLARAGSRPSREATDPETGDTEPRDDPVAATTTRPEGDADREPAASEWPRRWRLAPPPAGHVDRPRTAGGPHQRRARSVGALNDDGEQPTNSNGQGGNEWFSEHRVAAGASAENLSSSAALTARPASVASEPPRRIAPVVAHTADDPIAPVPLPAELVRPRRTDRAVSDASRAAITEAGATISAPAQSLLYPRDASTVGAAVVMSSDLESPALPDPRAIADRVAVLLDQESDLRGLG